MKWSNQPSGVSDEKNNTNMSRIVDSVPYPPVHRLTIREIFGTSG
jgi:hypothetical protein